MFVCGEVCGLNSVCVVRGWVHVYVCVVRLKNVCGLKVCKEVCVQCVNGPGVCV